MPKIDYGKYLAKEPNYEAFGGTKNCQSPTMKIMSNTIPGCNCYLGPGSI